MKYSAQLLNKEAMKELKPCPRCGNKSPLLSSWGDQFIVQCGMYTCDLEFCYVAPTREGCIEAWNKLNKEADND